jgi:nitroreductase
MKESIRELVKKSRSYRRFDEQRSISRETLIELVDIARFCPSARNHQPLRYVVSTDPGKTARIRDCLLFALDLPDWGGPVKGERPVGYITIVTSDKCTPYTGHDIGIAAQTLLLAAAERGFNGCMFGSIKKRSFNRCSRCLKITRSSSCWLSGTRQKWLFWKKWIKTGRRTTGGIPPGFTTFRNGGLPKS